MEALLREYLSTPIQITATPDAKFGEIVVLLYNKVEDEKEIKAICEEKLPPYWQPKRYIPIGTLPLTGTGKPDRATARRIARGK